MVADGEPAAKHILISKPSEPLLSLNSAHLMTHQSNITAPTHMGPGVASLDSLWCAMGARSRSGHEPTRSVSPASSVDSSSTSIAVDLTSHALKNRELFPSRKQREFIPDSKKDDNYWDRRRRNNEAAKRSREKRRINDMVLETRVLELTKENAMLRAELTALKEHFGVLQQPLMHSDVSLPIPVLTAPRRPKVLTTLLPSIVIGSEPLGSGHRSPVGCDLSENADCTRDAQPCEEIDPGMGPIHSLYPFTLTPPPSVLRNSGDINTPNHHRHLVIHGMPGGNRRSPMDTDHGGLSMASWSSEDGVHNLVVPETQSIGSVQVNQFSLPHKLRHKTHIGDKENLMITPTSPGDSGRSSCTSNREDSSCPSDVDSSGNEPSVSPRSSEDCSEMDCNRSRTGGQNSLHRVSYKGHSERQATANQQQQRAKADEPEIGNYGIKSEIQRLTSEVANLKEILMMSNRETEYNVMRRPAPSYDGLVTPYH